MKYIFAATAGVFLNFGWYGPALVASFAALDFLLRDFKVNPLLD